MFYQSYARCLYKGVEGPQSIVVCCSFSGAMLRYSGRYNDDMLFLNRRVWPLVQRVAYCHDSVSCQKFPASFPFPVERRGTEHLGERYDELSIGNRNDIHDLKLATVDCRCVPRGV